MSKLFRAMAFLVILGSCSSGYGTAPRDLDNACAIVNERPEYLRAFRATQRKWGVPIPTIMAMIYQESKFISNNRPPHQYALGVIPIGRQSSALGYSQALDGTWEEYQRSEGSSSSDRESIWDATDFMGWYMTATVRENGIAIGDTRNQYLAYHDGRTGFRRGTWRNKPWLVRIAGEIEQRAANYGAQLRSCGKI